MNWLSKQLTLKDASGKLNSGFEGTLQSTWLNIKLQLQEKLVSG